MGSRGRRVSGKGVSQPGTRPACLGKESGLYGPGRQWTPPKVFPEGNSLEAEDRRDGPAFRAEGMQVGNKFKDY